MFHADRQLLLLWHTSQQVRHVTFRNRVVKIGVMKRRWCPVKEAPYVLRERHDDLKLAPDDLNKLTIDIMPIGTIREFRVSHNFSTQCQTHNGQAKEFLALSSSNYLLHSQDSSASPHMLVYHGSSLNCVSCPALI